MPMIRVTVITEYMFVSEEAFQDYLKVLRRVFMVTNPELLATLAKNSEAVIGPMQYTDGSTAITTYRVER